MSDESRAHRWQRLLYEERETAERATRAAKTAGPAQRTNLARDWFAASARLLMEHARSRAQLHEGAPLEPFPTDAIVSAAQIMEHFAAGRMPKPVTDATASGGRPDRWPGERRDIATALHYIEWSKAGVTGDSTYNRTVADAFQVDRTTVHKWWRERKRICDGIRVTPVDRFPDALRQAGANYHFNRTGELPDGVD